MIVRMGLKPEDIAPGKKIKAIGAPRRDKPWMFRTYAGHSTAAASNRLYRSNLAKGQTGLSIAFDLPTQTGYDPDDEMARGEVGKVGVPVPHLGEMHTLFDGINLADVSVSMTINAPAAIIMTLPIGVSQANSWELSCRAGRPFRKQLSEYCVPMPWPLLGVSRISKVSCWSL